MSAWRKNALLLFIISTTRFPLIPRPLYVDSSWIKKKMPKIIDHLGITALFYLKSMEIHNNLLFSTKTLASSIKPIIFKSFHSQRKNEKITKSHCVKWWICCQYNKNAIPYRRFSEWKNAHYSGNMHFYNHFVVNNVSRTTYKAAVFLAEKFQSWKKREILQTIQNRILLQFFSKIKSCKLL